ncbi:MAG TPA: hypothetical protein VNL98_07080 [Gemmatimonadales bacterium]|nr:hypothetical protein [Gemmatimonadales bacterium]
MGAVTAAYPVWFRDALKRLMGLKFPPVDLATHWEGLRDLPPASVQAAVSRAARECDEFPSPQMLRAFAAASEPRLGLDEDRSRPLAEPRAIVVPQAGVTLPVTREWTFYCDTCEDTGWASFHCGGTEACGRDRAHAAHAYVQHCACWDSNPAVRRKRQRAAQQAHARTAKNG